MQMVLLFCLWITCGDCAISFNLYCRQLFRSELGFRIIFLVSANWVSMNVQVHLWKLPFKSFLQFLKVNLPLLWIFDCLRGKFCWHTLAQLSNYKLLISHFIDQVAVQLENSVRIFSSMVWWILWIYCYCDSAYAILSVFIWIRLAFHFHR